MLMLPCGLPALAQDLVAGGYSFREILIPGLSNISANALNNAGTIAGVSDAGPFVLRRDQLETIDIPGGTAVTPRGINGLGQIVGSYNDAEGNPRPFLRQRDGTITPLPWGSTGTNPGTAYGLNSFGTIVGDSFVIVEPGLQVGPAIISRRGQMSYFDLTAPGVSYTVLSGINLRGTKIGSVTLNERFASGGFFTSKSAAFILDRTGGHLIETPWPWVKANGINTRGTVVGTYIGTSNRVADNHGWVLDSGAITTVDLTSTNDWPAFVMAEIPDQGLRRFNLVGVGTSITSINDRGRIVARAFAQYVNRDTFRFLTFNRSYVGTPIHGGTECGNNSK